MSKLAAPEIGPATPPSSPNRTGGFRRLCANVSARARGLLGMNGETKNEDPKPDPFLHQLYDIHKKQSEHPFETFEKFQEWFLALPTDGQTALKASYMKVAGLI